MPLISSQQIIIGIFEFKNRPNKYFTKTDENGQDINEPLNAAAKVSNGNGNVTVNEKTPTVAEYMDQTGAPPKDFNKIPELGKDTKNVAAHGFNFGSLLSSLGDIAGLFPGVGPLIGTGLKVVGGLVGGNK